MTTDHFSMALYWSPDDEAFLARVIELPGCTAHGETREEAVRNAELAIRNWLDTASELGREIPEPDLEQQLELMEDRLAREGNLDAEVEWESRF